MSKKRSQRGARSSRWSDGTKGINPARPRPLKGEPMSANDVRDILNNPVYGYGIVLEPFDVAIAQVAALNRQLADEQRERGREFSLQELDQRFQKLFERLVNEGICKRGPDAPPIVTKEEWLKAQQVAIGRLARGEPM